MDKFSASKRHSVEKLLEYATIVGVTDAKTFLQILSDDETIDTVQKVKMIKSIVEALGENCFVRKKRYIKKRYRHAVNVNDDSTSSDEDIARHKRYTRPYRKYKARKCLKAKKTCAAESTAATDDRLKHLGDTHTAAATLTKCPQLNDMYVRKTLKNLVPRKELSESAEHFLDKYIRAYINSINYMKTAPADYMDLQPFDIEPLTGGNICMKKDSHCGPSSQKETAEVLKPVTPDSKATPSTSTHFSDVDDPIPQQKPFWKRLNRYSHATHCPEECDDETS